MPLKLVPVPLYLHSRPFFIEHFYQIIKDLRIYAFGYGILRIIYRKSFFIFFYPFPPELPELMFLKCQKHLQERFFHIRSLDSYKKICTKLLLTKLSQNKKKMLIFPSVADPKLFIPDLDPALNFPSSGSRHKFRIHADPYPQH